MSTPAEIQNEIHDAKKKIEEVEAKIEEVEAKSEKGDADIQKLEELRNEKKQQYKLMEQLNERMNIVLQQRAQHHGK